MLQVAVTPKGEGAEEPSGKSVTFTLVGRAHGVLGVLKGLEGLEGSRDLFRQCTLEA